MDYLVDPAGKYYNVTKDVLNKELAKNMGIKVAAIDSAGGINYKNKNLEYDSYLSSFISGTEGYLSSWNEEANTNTDLVIRGLGGGSQKAIKHCWNTGRTFYAIDTGYFGNVGKTKVWHRITKDALQHLGPIVEKPDDRLKKIMDYRYQKQTKGSKILICPPSEKVMNLFDQPDPETWVAQTIEELSQYTDREIEIRLKPSRHDRTNSNPIEAALNNDVYCLITYNSIAAIEALMFGKPAIALGPNAAQLICNTKISEVEDLKFPSKEEMAMFVRHLSYAQFTVAEMQNGTAWRILNEGS